MSTSKPFEQPHQFSITFSIENFPNLKDQVSLIVEHLELEWYLRAYRSEAEWVISLMSWKNGKIRSKLEVEASMFFLSPVEAPIGTAGRAPLDSSAEKVVAWQKANFKHTLRTKMVNNSVKVRCDWVVWETTLPPKWDFSIPSDSLINDVVLVVENREFHVSKAVLASFSAYFKTMFYEMFREYNESKVTLEDVLADDFQELLEVIYHKTDVTVENARELLELATYFNAPDVRNKCEQVLVGSPVDLKEKLLLADKYMLPQLNKTCMAELKSVEQLQEMIPEKVTDLNPSTIAHLLQKVVDFKS